MATKPKAKAAAVQLPDNKTLVLRAMFTDTLGGGTEPSDPVVWTSSDLSIATLEATDDQSVATVVPSVNLGVVTATATAGQIVATYDVEVIAGDATAAIITNDPPKPMTDAQLAKQQQQKASAPPPVPPVNVDAPYVSQSAGVLNCTTGNWQGEPTSYSYRWQMDGTDVAGTDGTANLTVQPDEVGKTATCIVTASNTAGSTEAPPSNSVVVA